MSVHIHFRMKALEERLQQLEQRFEQLATQPKERASKFVAPLLQDIIYFALEFHKLSHVEATEYAQQFFDFYESKGWMIGKNKMKDWKAAARRWKPQVKSTNNSNTIKNGKFSSDSAQRIIEEAGNIG